MRRMLALAALLWACGEGPDDDGNVIVVQAAGGSGGAAAGSAGAAAGSGAASGSAGAATGGSAGKGPAGSGGQAAAGNAGAASSGASGKGGQAAAGNAGAAGSTAAGGGGAAGQGISGSSGQSGAGAAGAGAAGAGAAGAGAAGTGASGAGAAGAGQGGAGGGQAGSGGGGGASGAGGQGGAVPPSTGNLGWVGGACDQDSDCKIDGGFCQKGAYPNGYCTAPCSLFCPDRTEPGDTGTFCVDGSTLGQSEGACFSKCDEGVFPGTGCAPGYACAERNRYADPDAVASVCVPAKGPGACDAGGDLLIPLPYPDTGMVWIPAEARCGGAFDLVVMLHGINPGSNPTPSLGGGRRLELLARGLIDGGLMRPVVLAEPVHFQGSSTQLYGAEFSPETHLDLVKEKLLPHKVTIASLGYTGHSGAGCDASNGLYKVLDRYGSLIPAYAPFLSLWGLEDICYESSYHWLDPLKVLGPTSTPILNVYSVQGNPADFEAGLLPDAEAMPCDGNLFTGCIRSPSRPWCSYRTRADAGITHDNNPYFFVREVFPQVFPPGASKQPCH